MTRILCMIAMIVLLVWQADIARAVVSPTATDSRIRTFVYGENEVFRVFTEYGYQSNIEFAKDERVVTISMGSSVGFRVTPSKNRLFIKTLRNSSHTNMTVVTNKRAYQFELSSFIEDDRDIIYVMRFFYPEEHFDKISTPKKPVVPTPAKHNLVSPVSGEFHQDITLANIQAPTPVSVRQNFNYSLSGPNHIAPLKVFDNGRATFFKFANNLPQPSIYAVNSNGTESPLPTRRQGEYLVVDRVMARIALHHGSNVVCVFNDNRPSPRMR